MIPVRSATFKKIFPVRIEYKQLVSMLSVTTSIDSLLFNFCDAIITTSSLSRKKAFKAYLLIVCFWNDIVCKTLHFGLNENYLCQE